MQWGVSYHKCLSSEGQANGKRKQKRLLFFFSAITANEMILSATAREILDWTQWFFYFVFFPIVIQFDCQSPSLTCQQHIYNKWVNGQMNWRFYIFLRISGLLICLFFLSRLSLLKAHLGFWDELSSSFYLVQNCVQHIDKPRQVNSFGSELFQFSAGTRACCRESSCAQFYRSVCLPGKLTQGKIKENKTTKSFTLWWLQWPYCIVSKVTAPL